MSSRSSFSVLVADDDTMCRESIRSLLEREGLLTYPAASGTQALEFVKREVIDLVILDQYMPDITGIETLKRIVGMRLRLPSIIMSGEVTNETKMEAMNAGAFTFISKPIQTAIMRDAVQQIIDRYYRKGRRRPWEKW